MSAISEKPLFSGSSNPVLKSVFAPAVARAYCGLTLLRIGGMRCVCPIVNPAIEIKSPAQNRMLLCFFASSGMCWGVFIGRDRGLILPGGKRCPSCGRRLSIRHLDLLYGIMLRLSFRRSE